ncbi:MAG: hypothetical protein A2782_00055 [Candidatus Blackburnbacteria bacterium RIFCSPHIGHO2_01_FULL_43_15b]|uniref:Uncharacterized protein n=1 Tax=Candidatus Blackburnbacteria bacterium RIFCSPHIGHO2_01_FULL_43_15b TaxID=1797513 RepID=A0A1G1V152_9BACT|nr:MAG: hypothetical protein A2782_00055 [Candidatus Blackburnbacteria bacterium RIFCSPHIGHO2_01_FULL_43_15b]
MTFGALGHYLPEYNAIHHVGASPQERRDWRGPTGDKVRCNEVGYGAEAECSPLVFRYQEMAGLLREKHLILSQSAT